MFEAECPSCEATYQMDERRVPPKGLKMRCPKCGESFQVTAPGGQSLPPVLGAVLGLTDDGTGGRPPPPKRKATMRGGADAPSQSPTAAKAPPRPPNRTMLGVAPNSGGLELAALEDDTSPGAADEDELDLLSFDDEVDLPSPTSERVSDGLLDFADPDSDQRGSAGSDDELDLPTLGGSGPDSAGEFDLPALNAGSDLPSPVGAELPDLNVGLPELGGQLPELGGELPDLGLPTVGGSLPSVSGKGLPTLGGSLPSLAGELPGVRGAPGQGELEMDELVELEHLGAPESSLSPDSMDFGAGSGFDLSNPSRGPESGGASSADDIFGQGPTFSPETIPPRKNESLPPRQETSGAGMGEFTLGDAASEDGSEEFDAFPTESKAASGHSAGSAEGYGDVSLDGEDGDIALGADVDHDAAPAPLSGPRGGTRAAASASVELPTSNAQKKGAKTKRRRTSGLSRGTRVVLAATVVLAIGGGALSLVPEIGPYGAYFLIDTMNAPKYQAQLLTDIQTAERRLGLDSAQEVDRAFSELALGRASAPRFKPRTAYLAYLGFFHQLRFGASSTVSTQAQVLLNELAEAPQGTPYLDLARLTQTAATGKVEAITADAARLIKISRDHAVVVGEAALKRGDGELATLAWKAVLDAKGDARANFGMARAFRISKKPVDAEKYVQATLQENPNHAGARLLVAALHLKDRNKDDEVLASLTPLSEGRGASAGEQVQALVLLGELHLKRSRIKKAEAAFTIALQKDSGNASAQKGLAQALFDSGRFSEALARFEASLQTEPDSIDAKLGLVRCQLRLEQLDDAVKHLDGLLEKHPKSSAVAYWVGNGKEAIGEKGDAIKAYEKAIEHGEESPELVLSYLALTRLLSQKGNHAEAEEVISQAEKRFPDDPTIYASLGELSISRGSYDEAVSHYDKALKLDAKNIGLRFARGVALRQARRFDEAGEEFNKVEKESSDYPGLALERGNLYEASGRTEEALKAYETALAAAPNDLDLMLRVACGKAGAGQSESVLKLVEPVLDERGNSAEANFCKGLAILNSGKDANQAKLFLERAVARDVTRAKYHLYVGWVALELQDFAKANQTLNKAIELDRTLADAYWKRGELRVRQGAVVDALGDLDKALELAPGRVEAHAARARAMMQLGKEVEAMAAWSKAVEAEHVDPTWNKDYGELLLNNRRPAEAREQLQKAVEGGNAETPAPVWLANAQRQLAMAIGRHKDAIPHWEAFLKAKQGTNDPYIREALSELTALMNQSGY